MRDEITFLGTAGGRFACSRQVRASGGIIMNLEGLQFCIDPGPGALWHARQTGIDITQTDVVIASHNHLDHQAELNAVVDAMHSERPRRKKGIIFSTQEVLSITLSPYHASKLEKKVPVEEGNIFNLNDMRMIATRIKHTAKGFGFKIYCKDYVIGYVSDTEYFRDLPKQFSDADILIKNQTCTDESFAKGHMRIRDTVKMLSQIKPKLVILTHFGIPVIKKNPTMIARDIQKETGLNVTAAHDYMKMNPIDYVAKGSQKRLKQF